MMRLSRKQIGRSVMCTALVAVLAVTQQRAAFAQKPATPKPPATATGASTAGKSGAASLAEAKRSYQSGEAKYKSGDYLNALAEFQTADSIKQTPQAARYIGLCQDKLGKYPEAVAAYDRFLADVPAKMQTEGAEIKKRSDEIKAMPGKIHVDANAPAMVTVDQQPVKAMTPSDLDLTPGKHTLHFTADGRIAQDKDVEVAFASKQDVRAELEAQPVPVAGPPPPVAAAPPAPLPAAPPPEPRSKVPAYVTGGLAIVAAGVGTVFGVMALSDKSDFDKSPSASKADDGENHALVADMSFGVAITLGVTSAVLFLTKDEPVADKDKPADKPAASASPSSRPLIASAPPAAPPRAPRITVTPTPIVTQHGGGAGALFRF